MNQVITSKEAIMRECRVIVAEQGIKAINMRTVAKKCGIAPGTLYNYYSDKEELVIAAIESVWEDIFRIDRKHEAVLSFPDYVNSVFERIRRGLREYPDFFMAHSMAIADSEKGKALKENCFGNIKHGLSEALRQDKGVSENAFGDDFGEKDFLDFVFSNIMLCFVQGKDDCSGLVKVIKRVIYP